MPNTPHPASDTKRKASPSFFRKTRDWFFMKLRPHLLGPSHLTLPDEIKRLSGELEKMRSLHEKYAEVILGAETEDLLDSEAAQEAMVEYQRECVSFLSKQQQKNKEFLALFQKTKKNLEDAKIVRDRNRRDIDLIMSILEMAAENPEVFWLFGNRVERMDAAVPMYDELRRQFHLARYRFAAGYVRGLRVADIACGVGYGAEILAEQGGAAMAVGVDIEFAAVRYATRRHKRNATHFQCASGYATGLRSTQFDAIVSFETIEHVQDDIALLREFARLLRPGGILIVSTPNSWPLDLSKFHVHEYNRTTFEKVLSECFEIQSLFNQNSGSAWEYNHNQPAGIVPTTPANQLNAECYIAVCRRKDR